MNLNISYSAVLILIAGIFVSQNALQIYAQNSELIDLRTGKPTEKKNSPRFQITSRANGTIIQTNIKFSSYVIETNDEQKLTRNIYYSVNQSDTKKYFKVFMSQPRKIIERGKIKTKDSAVFERIVSEAKAENGKYYEIIIYDGGKRFVSIAAKNLDLALEVENWLTTQK